uniref:NADH dehydrogenase subunit 5 n=1 Tax=Erythrolobus coxiae TaxID=362235 RepID=UPI001FCE0F04|nr:NADH dehydrogenase subunit 5 [Erythrolobus coxiae]UNJ19021.1 NADH dehydrogenase subunit 5 [Erythrolobus coxiae]
MLLTIILFPFFSFFFSSFFGRFLGYKGTFVFTTTLLFVTMLMSWIIFLEAGFFNSKIQVNLKIWLNIELLIFFLSFSVDGVTSIMIVMISTISAIVHLYSSNYMLQDPHNTRFFSYLSLFTFFMLFLVISNNLICLFFGWEGIGLASYLLINYWFTRLYANQSSIKAILLNRIGDFGLWLGILGSFHLFKSCDYEIIFLTVPFFIDSFLIFLNQKIPVLNIISFFFFFGAVGKSAQLSLHTWLVDAMEGPSPVSALIHAATLVTAGVFLLIRLSPLLEYSEITLFLIAIVGSLSCISAATSGIFQNDFKRVIAYSTASQLGLIISVCGVSQYNISLYHLANHAFFKASLFLCAGYIIYCLNDEQDLRKMGGLSIYLPLTYLIMLISTLSLIGFPFLSGFFSKDFLLEISWISQFFKICIMQSNYIYTLNMLSTFFTTYYSFRLLFFVFFSTTKVPKTVLLQIAEIQAIMLISLILLFFSSIFIGFLWSDFFIGLGSNFWAVSLHLFELNSITTEVEQINIVLKILPFLISIFGISVSIFNFFFESFFLIKMQNFFLIKLIYILLNKKWYWDFIYNKILNFCLKLSYSFFLKTLDKGLIEYLVPSLIHKLYNYFAFYLCEIHKGYIIYYIYFFLINFFLFVHLLIIFQVFYILKFFMLYFWFFIWID